MTWCYREKKVSKWTKLKHFLRHGHRYHEAEYYLEPVKHVNCRCQLVKINDDEVGE